MKTDHTKIIKDYKKVFHENTIKKSMWWQISLGDSEYPYLYSCDFDDSLLTMREYLLDIPGVRGLNHPELSTLQSWVDFAGGLLWNNGKIEYDVLAKYHVKDMRIFDGIWFHPTVEGKGLIESPDKMIYHLPDYF